MTQDHDFSVVGSIVPRPAGVPTSLCLLLLYRGGGMIVDGRNGGGGDERVANDGASGGGGWRRVAAAGEGWREHSRCGALSVVLDAVDGN